MKTILSTLTLLLVCFFAFGQTGPNLITEDIEGNPINIQEDYLDNGIPVLINFWAAWNLWDQYFMDTMSMQNAYEEYGPNGTGQIMMLAYEIDASTTDEDLTTGIQGIPLDWTELINYPIINPEDPSWALDTMNVAWMPSLALFCPDGTIYVENLIDSVTFDFPVVQTADLTYGNLLTVDGVTDVFENLCGSIISDENVSGTIYYNSGSCTTSGATPLSNALVTFDDGTNQYIRSTNQFGYYEAFLPDGTYSLSYEYGSSLMSICDQPASVTINGDIHPELDVVYQADVLCPEVVLELDPFILRPCENNSYISFQACNYGTVPLDVYNVNLEFPVGSEIIHVSPDMSYIYNATTGVFKTTCDSLDVFGCKSVQIAFHTPCSTEIGDTLCFELQSSPIQINPDCSEYIQETATACNGVIGSYDPNDKTGMTPGKGTQNYIDAGTELEYLIRFQNTGTDTAFLVRIDDPLSTVFDHTSIRPLSSSHDYEMSYSDGMVSFKFPDILLVDSFKNEPESHGFVKFKINLRDDLEPGTLIPNYANIYFDGNEAVLTNTYEYTVTVPVKTENWETTEISLFPNPAQNELYLSIDNTENKLLEISIYDMRGQQLMRQFMRGNSHKLSLDDIQSGLYLIQINDEESKQLLGTQKFVKK